MPIVPVKLASAGAGIRMWVKGLHTGDSQLTALAPGFKGYKDRVPEGGVYPCYRHFVQLTPDIYAQRRGSAAYVETQARLLVSWHSSKADDDDLLAALASRTRAILELHPPITNRYGTMTDCFYNSDWMPGIASIDGDEHSFEGYWFDVVFKRARLA